MHGGFLDLSEELDGGASDCCVTYIKKPDATIMGAVNSQAPKVAFLRPRSQSASGVQGVVSANLLECCDVIASPLGDGLANLYPKFLPEIIARDCSGTRRVQTIALFALLYMIVNNMFSSNYDLSG